MARAAGSYEARRERSSLFAHSHGHKKRAVVRFAFGFIVFTLVFISFLLGHYTKVGGQEPSTLSENKAEQEWNKVREENIQDTWESEHQQFSSKGTGDYSQPSSETLQQQQQAAPHDMMADAAWEPKEDGKNGTIGMEQDIIVKVEPWNVHPSNTTSSLLSESIPLVAEKSWSENSSRDIPETKSTYGSFDGWNISQTLLELTNSSNVSSSYNSQRRNVSLILDDKLTIKKNKASDDIAGCFEMCRQAKHEVFSGVPVSSIFQYPRLGGNGTHSVLLLFHGCEHSAEDWFVLPEEVLVVCEALRRNWSVVAFSSTDRTSGCWDLFYPALGNRDVIRVYQSLQEWIRKYFVAADNLQLYALGVSSGGSFVSILSTFLPHISAQAIYMSPGSFLPLSSSFHWTPPPTCFVHMSKDTTFGSLDNVKKTCDQLSQVPCRIVSLDPVPVTPDFFHRKIPNISLSESQQFFQWLNSTEWLDAQGYLVKNPRTLEYTLEYTDNRTGEQQQQQIWKTYQKSIEEILNRAFGVHEMAADDIEEILNWLQQQQ